MRVNAEAGRNSRSCGVKIRSGMHLRKLIIASANSD
jgi:hypothetical protein